MKPRFSLHDLVTETASALTSRPSRLVLATLGTVLGIGTLVATIALSQTSAARITEHFDAISATEVIVLPSGEQGVSSRIPWDGDDQARWLAGVQDAGMLSTVSDSAAVQGLRLIDPLSTSTQHVPLMAATPGLFQAIGARVDGGRLFDVGHEQRRDHVVVLGSDAAIRLGITRLDASPSIMVNAVSMSVIGIVGSVDRHTELLDAIVVPQQTARLAFGLTAPKELYIRTHLGAATLIGSQIATSIDPNHLQQFDISVPPSPDALRSKVKATANELFLALGVLTLLGGASSIANVSLLSVLERVGEIGLRRSLGARRRHIALQFLTESSVVGFLGGLIGSSVGASATVALSVMREWTPVLDVRILVCAPLLGMFMGLTAGCYPAWKASAIEPVAALRMTYG